MLRVQVYESVCFPVVVFEVGWLAVRAREQTSRMLGKHSPLSSSPSPLFVLMLISLTLSEMLHLLEWPGSRSQAVPNADEYGAVGTVIH